MGKLLDGLKDEFNYGITENGAKKHLTTKSDVLDMFALCGSYRNRSDDDCILAFKKAYEENAELALKCLFYLRDVRGGQGERRFFRVCFKWLAVNDTEAALRNLPYISEYGRWDDLIYSCIDTPCKKEMLKIIEDQLALDLCSKTPSLLGKWMPSENASSKTTKAVADQLRTALGLSHRDYRKMLSFLRSKINIVEKLMSENRWDEIEFDKIPSKAGIIYKNAFARRDILAKKYEAFAKDKDTKVNAKTLYPYDIAHQAFYCKMDDEVNREMIQKFWDNLPDYYNGRVENSIAIVDVSGSMYGRPLEAAVSLGAYVAEHSKGLFANHFITFSSNPQLVKFEGTDIVDKFRRAGTANWGGSTNIEKTMNLLLETAIKNEVPSSEMPTTLYIFSDMEFDQASEDLRVKNQTTFFESMRKIWATYGYTLPKVIFWNLDGRSQNIPALGREFSYVSGLSPVMIETILGGKDGYDLMIAKLVQSGRYDCIH